MMTNYNAVFAQRGIWEIWHTKTWDDYIHPFYREEVKKLVEAETDKNIILYGDNGMGKSMLMNLAMMEFVKKGFSVQVIDFRHLIKAYIQSWREDSRIAEFMLCDYLAIDDLGKEFQSEGMSKELAITTLDYVLRYRFQRKKSTWLTFNMGLKDVKSTYNGHVASLLKRNTIAILFEGDDFGDTQLQTIKKPK